MSIKTIDISNVIYLITKRTNKGFMRGYIGQAKELHNRTTQHIAAAYDGQKQDRTDGAAKIIASVGAYKCSLTYWDASDLVSSFIEMRDEHRYIMGTNWEIEPAATDMDVAELMFILSSNYLGSNLAYWNTQAGGQRTNILRYKWSDGSNYTHITRWEKPEKALNKFLNPQADANWRRLVYSNMDDLLNPTISGADPSFRNAMNAVVADNISPYIVGMILKDETRKAAAISKIKSELRKLYTKRIKFESGTHTLKDELLLMMRKKTNVDDVTYKSLDIGRVTFDFDVIINKILGNVKRLTELKFWEDIAKAVSKEGFVDSNIEKKAGAAVMQRLKSNADLSGDKKLNSWERENTILSIQSASDNMSLKQALENYYNSAFKVAHQEYSTYNWKVDVYNAVEVVFNRYKEKTWVPTPYTTSIHSFFAKDAFFQKKYYDFIRPLLSYYEIVESKKTPIITAPYISKSGEIQQQMVFVKNVAILDSQLKELYKYTSKSLFDAVLTPAGIPYSEEQLWNNIVIY